MLVMKIVGLTNGTPTPFDGQYLKEYDPSIDGVDPSGKPMNAYVFTTPDPADAMQFEDATELHAVWARVDPRRPMRADGKPNRPLTSFTVQTETV